MLLFGYFESKSHTIHFIKMYVSPVKNIKILSCELKISEKQLPRWVVHVSAEKFEKSVWVVFENYIEWPYSELILK